MENAGQRRTTADCRSRKDATKTATEQFQDMDSKSHTFAFHVRNRRAKNTTDLLLDTGATSHIINDQSKFVDFHKDFDPRGHVTELADGSKANVVLGKGNANVLLYDVNGHPQDVILNDALFVPSHDQNIFFCAGCD